MFRTVNLFKTEIKKLELHAVLTKLYVKSGYAVKKWIRVNKVNTQSRTGNAVKKWIRS